MPERALLYCSKLYKKCPSVYSYLLEYYIENDQLERIVELLKQNEIHLPIEKTLNLIPDDIDLGQLSILTKALI